MKELFDWIKRKYLCKVISRQLVKETLGARTNDYTKLANIIFDKETETVYSENEVFDADINVNAYCEQAKDLYEKFCDCYTTEQVTAVIDDSFVVCRRIR